MSVTAASLSISPPLSSYDLNRKARPIIADLSFLALSPVKPEPVLERKLWIELRELMNGAVGNRTKKLMHSSRKRLLIQAGYGGDNAYSDIHALIMGNLIMHVHEVLPLASPGTYDVLLALHAAMQTTYRDLNSMANHQRISEEDRRQGRWNFVESLDEMVGKTDGSQGMSRLEVMSRSSISCDAPELSEWRSLLHFLSDIQFRIIMVSWGLVSIDAPQVVEILRGAKRYGNSKGLRAEWATTRVLSVLFDLPSSAIRYHYDSAEKAILSRPGCLEQIRLQLTGGKSADVALAF